MHEPIIRRAPRGGGGGCDARALCTPSPDPALLYCERNTATRWSSRHVKSHTRSTNCNYADGGKLFGEDRNL
jgi:hypothetical protein